MMKTITYVSLFISGCYGAYGFTIDGVNNPLVWALEGSHAPYLWLFLFGVVLDSAVRRNIFKRAHI